MDDLKELPKGKWFCCIDCNRVHSALQNLRLLSGQMASDNTRLLLSKAVSIFHIYGDPEAADIVFTSGANIVITVINITTQVIMTDADLDELRQSEGRHAQLSSAMCKCYRDLYVESLGVYGIFLRDPVSFVALVRPDLFTYKKGVV
ncbi:Uridine nucleosidase 1 [Camellia lanceoleosa]|uniref:Uridine nucleosidase 1 n=1 Tax=Camellia lanceoleosa TaxID=1840588 RepID=A0ACC0GC54_9ERIC|nr:Uridine nucleosidase 1 [Camellia lanceoleosa]